MGVAIGIDLGTTNTCAAVATPEGVEFVLGPNGERVHPSVVALPAQGGIVVGADAKLFRLTEPDRVIYSAKRFIGQNIRAPLVQLAMTGIPYALGEGKNQQVVANVGNRQLTMTEISAHVLRHVRERASKQLGATVDKAVITVPANFTDAQRQATKEAGRLAGLDVMRLINEPTAAALAYGFGQRLDEHALVFDFGGGTLDISVLRLAGEVVEVISSDGDFFLGGDDFDRSLTEFLAAECNRALRIDPRPHAHLMAKLSMGAEAIKCHLSENSSAEGDIDDLELAGRAFRLPFKIARRQFETMISGYLERAMVLTKQTLSAAHLTPHDIGNVLCVGGSTRIPAVRNALAELFGRQPDISINPDEVVAQGAAIQAGTLSGILHAAPAAAPTRNTQVAPLALGAVPISGTVPRPLLLDVNPSTLSVQTAGGFVDNLLDKNSPIPIERTRMFSTVRDGQTRVEIDCCRGEGKRYADNEPLGKLLLEGIPERERGKTRIEVTFRVDADGILQVRARDADSGVEQRAKLSVLGAPE